MAYLNVIAEPQKWAGIDQLGWSNHERGNLDIRFDWRGKLIAPSYSILPVHLPLCCGTD